MRPISLIFLLIMLWHAVDAQNVKKNSVIGRVLLVETSDSPVLTDTIAAIGTEVLIDKTSTYTMTDMDGNFFLPVNNYGAMDKIFLILIHPNYKKKKIKVDLAKADSVVVIFTDKDLQTTKDDTRIVTPYKPAIYLYPTEATTVSVKHDFKGVIGTTYPAYDSGWMVIAQPNGSLFNLKDNRNYEYLFWDGEIKFPEAHFQFKEGFTVEKRNYASFLLQKLTLVGFNIKEINDFVVYWLPMLNEHPRCFIHFRINDNIDNSSILTVTPKPDSEIRLFMEFKPLNDDFNIKEQVLQPYKRTGFHLTEWGGSPIKELQVIQ